MQPSFIVGDDGCSPDTPLARPDLLDQHLAPCILFAKRDLATLTNYLYESFHTITDHENYGTVVRPGWGMTA